MVIVRVVVLWIRFVLTQHKLVVLACLSCLWPLETVWKDNTSDCLVNQTWACWLVVPIVWALPHLGHLLLKLVLECTLEDLVLFVGSCLRIFHGYDGHVVQLQYRSKELLLSGRLHAGKLSSLPYPEWVQHQSAVTQTSLIPDSHNHYSANMYRPSMYCLALSPVYWLFWLE